MTNRVLKSIYFYPLFIVLFLSGESPLEAAIDPPGLLKKEHISELQFLREKAVNKAAQNLNRFAIEDLKRYDELLDSLSAMEIADSVLKLEAEYDRSTGGRKQELEKNARLIEEYNIAKASNKLRYNNLVRKAGIAFAAWFLIVLILLQVRKTHLRKRIKLMNESDSRMSALLMRADLGSKLFSVNKTILPVLEKIYSDTHELQSASVPGGENGTDSLTLKLNSLMYQVNTELSIHQYISQLQNDPGDELIPQDINSICETSIDIADRGFSMGMPPEAIKITKNFEKNLPAAKLIPEALKIILLNILSNSFQAVKQKLDEGIKGYQPQITISTRILPRFLQIRIRDNGRGIPKDKLEKVTEEFFTLKNLEEGAGLGLALTTKLLGEPHKGEMKIESDVDEGTDVYIKFFI